MLIKEFISKSDKNTMISMMFKYYRLKSIRVKEKSIENHAHFNVDTGTLELSTKYKQIKTIQLKDFLITILHEIKHAIDAKRYGWKKFKRMYEMEQNMISQGHYPGKDDPYKDNKYEIDAENFGRKNFKKWYMKFKKERFF
tara:strand:+ start:4518 stop:4940 length:423 start_codon:yes stop_codon:yes gene_type:complete